jgi:hypothetical protein
LTKPPKSAIIQCCSYTIEVFIINSLGDFTMKGSLEVFITVVALIILVYFGVGIYLASDLIFANTSVAEAKTEIEEMDWTSMCEKKKAGKKSYFDCGQNVEERSKEFLKEISLFEAKTSGLWIFKTSVQISKETWNTPRLEIYLWGLDIFWVFREKSPPPPLIFDEAVGNTAAASFFIQHETMSKPRLLLPRPLSKLSLLLAELHRW